MAADLWKKHATPNELQAVMLIDGYLQMLRWQEHMLCQKRARIINKAAARSRYRIRANTKGRG